MNHLAHRFSRLSAALLLGAAVLAPALAASPANAPARSDKVLPSGVRVHWLTVGSGARPVAADTVTVHYRGTLTDGKEFDSSYRRGTPASFPLNRVVPCWTQALWEMNVGDTAELTCPASTAYGERGIPGVIPPNSTLKFQVELLAVPGRE